MSMERCDCCELAVDTDFNVEGRYDEKLGLFICERCLNHWEAYVVGGVMEQEKQT